MKNFLLICFLASFFSNAILGKSVGHYRSVDILIVEPGTLSGNQYICTTGTTTTTFTSTVSGGTWSSSAPSIATVDSASGVVTAVAEGTATIIYTVSGETATRDVYVSSSAPSAPGTATPYSPTCNGFTAQWGFVLNATKFFIDVSTDSAFSTFAGGYDNFDVGNVMAYTLTGLNPGTTYYYRVRAYGGCGASSSSATMSFATAAIPITPPTASDATNLGCDYATLNWTSVPDGTSYYLDIATDSAFLNFVPNYNNLLVGYNDLLFVNIQGAGFYANNLPDGVLYYRVRATNYCNVITGNSNVISFQTKAPFGGSVSPTQSVCAGNAPANDLTISGYTTENTVITKWQSATDEAFTANVVDIAETTAVLSKIKIGVLNVNTYFRAVVQEQLNTYCSSFSDPVLITVGSSASGASSSETPCINTVMNNITHTTTGFTGISGSGVSGANGLPLGVSASFASNTVTISGTPIESGVFNYSIPLTGANCGTANATGTIIVKPLPAAAGGISGSPSVSRGQSGVAYSVTAIGNATGYTWNLPPGATIASGLNTNAITVDYSAVAISGNMTVLGTNGCGNGVVSANYLVTVGPALGNSSFDKKEKSVMVLVNDRQIKVYSSDEKVEKIMVYDLRGSLLYEKKGLGGNEFTIPNFSSSEQFLIVMVQLANGKWVKKEIVF